MFLQVFTMWENIDDDKLKEADRHLDCGTR